MRKNKKTYYATADGNVVAVSPAHASYLSSLRVVVGDGHDLVSHVCISARADWVAAVNTAGRVFVLEVQRAVTSELELRRSSTDDHNNHERVLCCG